MKKTIFSLVLLILSGFLLSGCSSQNTPQTNTPSSQTSPAVTQVSQATNTVSIKNFAFDPSTLTVKVGTTVTWINNDSAVHKIKSDTFNSQDLNQGDKFEFTFNAKGSFDYSCSIHPSMQGKMVVE